jgi:hypothetical protein
MKKRSFCNLARAFLLALLASAPALRAAGTATIYWQAVQNDTSGQPVTLPIHYYVYRDTIPTFQPNKDNFLTATSDTFITDKDNRLADAGKHLFYVVRAQDAWGNFSRFSNRIGEVPFVAARVKVLLQSVYQPEADSMECRLKEADILPFLSPYNASPRNVAELSGHTVDWILLQLLHPASGLVVASRAFLLRQNGELVELDGNNNWLGVPMVEPGLYRLRVTHRNHAAVTLTDPFQFTAETGQLFDFAQDSTIYAAATQACRLKQAVWGLKVGDLNGDQLIDDADYQVWRRVASRGAAGYQAADLNFDGQVTSRDYVIWYNNKTR